jgi:hypothetical protein
MGLKHEAKKGTVIEVNGVKITVLRGSPQLEITAPPEIPIKTSQTDIVSRKVTPVRTHPVERVDNV